MQNGKHALAKGLIDGIGFASTEFHVIRPGREIDARWIHAFLRQPSILTEATNFFTGAVGQQRVPDDFLHKLRVPLAPMPEQQRIVALLREQLAAVERARAAAQARLEAAAALPVAYLRSIFEGSRAKQWPVCKLGTVLELRREVVHPRDKPFGPSLFVGLEHIQSGTGRRVGSVEVRKEELSGRKPQFYRGDIVYGYLRPYLNKVWVAEFDGLCSVDQYVFMVNTQKADREFLAWFMRSPVYLERAPVDVTPGWLPRIRTEEVAATMINLPGLPEQRALAVEISSIVKQIHRLTEAAQEELAATNVLLTALLRRAFNGDI